MGVPKFYRWLSERYPCLSETVKEQQIPGFDNLYLDMNGIIHNCSHPNDEDPHFRIAEEKIFADIFHYIEFLFRMIKPQKVFFMAVDGVAPRAKMNQQRGRRFRTARDAEILRKQAIEKGEILPAEKQFDSNCITPGTEFMAKLHSQLKFFISMKISTDKSWRKCKVYFSGHETPGEGEHKIMDFIRYHKAQPDYDPNTRHCLYGLDADLIMLGLCTHEPHFSVLREEVTYGKKSQKRECIPEQITFHLLHLSLLRDYISHEFQSVKSKLSFAFDLEKIVDDWVLMGFLVGNDFIPNIPGLHINKNALPSLYKAYIEVLPTLDGYINENGFLNLKRFEVYLKRLAQMDLEQFKEVSGDFKYLESKMSRPHRNPQSGNSGCLLDGLAALDEDNGFEDIDSDNSDEISNMEFSQHKRNYYITKMEYESVTKEVLQEQATEYVRAIQWNLHYYYNGIISWSWYYPHHYAPYISDVTDFADLKLEYEMGQPFLPFQQLLGVLPEASKILLPLPYQALMTDDASPLKKFYPIDFQLDQNGKQNEWEAVVLIPFIDENLLVSCMEKLDDELTADEINRNKHGPHLLYSYTDEALEKYQSTLPVYYPDIHANHAKCTEIHKNSFFLPSQRLKKGLCDGVRLDSYTPGFPTLGHIPHTAKLKKAQVSVFNTPVRNDCMVLTLLSEDNDDDKKSLKRHLRYVDVSAWKEPIRAGPAMPSFAGARHDSKGSAEGGTLSVDLMDFSHMLGKEIFVGWPHLKVAKVDGISDGSNRLQFDEDGHSVLKSLTKFEKDIWRKRVSNVEERYLNRWGVEIGSADILVEVALMNGKRFACIQGNEISLEKQWTRQITAYALQAIVQDIPLNIKEEDIFETVDDLFPPGLHCFYLGNPGYGALAIVEGQSGNTGKIPVKMYIHPEISFSQLKKKDQVWRQEYLPLYQVAQRLGIDRHVISRFTGTFLVQTNLQESMNAAKVNIGLNLKFNKKNEEVPGYSRKGADGNWLYSIKTLEIMSDYLEKFPELFDNLSANLNKDYVHMDDLFPRGNGKTYIQNILSWLKDLPCTSQPRRTCGSMFLDPSVVEEVERIVDCQKEDECKVIETSLEPHVLYRPLPSQYISVADSSATFMLFDRIVNVREGYAVPLGLKGTIIGLPGLQTNDAEPEPDALYDIVFDEEFPGGISLNCSKYRGYRLNSSALINLSYGIRASKPSQAQVTPRRNQVKHTSSNNSNSYARVFHSPKSNSNMLAENTSQNKSVKNSSSSVDNGMVRLEWKSGKPRRRIAQETPPANTHQFNHSPHSPFVPHLLSSNENKFFPTGNNTTSQFVTPKAPTTQSVKRAKQPTFPNYFTAKQDAPGSQDEFTSIWGELKQAKQNTVTQTDPSPIPISIPIPSQSQSQNETKVPSDFGSSSSKAGFTKVSVDEIIQQAKAAEEAVKAEVSPQRAPSGSAAIQLLQLVTSTTGDLPSYKYFTCGPTPLYGAELTLPGWQRTFHSTRFHPSKELACENAAQQALLALQNLSSGSLVPNVRPSLPPPFKSAPFLPRADVQGKLGGVDPSLSSAALMLPVVPPCAGLTPPPVRAPPPPNIYNIPPSFVAHNHMLATQWEQQKLQAQQNQMQARSYKQKQSQPLYQPPPAQPRNPVLPAQQKSTNLNTNAVEFIPTQVARKRAVSKQKSQESNSTTVEPQLANLTLSNNDPASAESKNTESKNTESTCTVTPKSQTTATSTPSPSSNAPKRKGRSRLAVKFNNQPN